MKMMRMSGNEDGGHSGGQRIGARESWNEIDEVVQISGVASMDKIIALGAQCVNTFP